MLRHLLALDGVLDSANGVLNLALDLIHHAFVLQLLVTGQLARTFLERTLRAG
jgi:hypothetical protein